MKIIYWILFLGSVGILYLWLAQPFYSGDIKNHIIWANSIIADGTFGFYERRFHNFFDPNYPPLAMISFAGSLWIYQWVVEQIGWLNGYWTGFPSKLVPWILWENTQMVFMKLFGMISLIGVGILGYLMVRTEITGWKRYLVPILLVLNPTAIYISVVWGQIDVVPIIFLLSSLFLILRKQFLLSGAMIGLALLSKQSVIIYLPVFVYILYRLTGKSGWMHWSAGAFASFYLLHIPFTGWSPLSAVQQYLYNLTNVPQVVQDNALNLWGIMFGFQSVSDRLLFWGVSYEWWGRILFIGLITIPFWWFHRGEPTLKRILIILQLLTVVYFLVLTRMHERYLIPAILFQSILVIFDRRYSILLVLLTGFHFINLYRGMHEPNMPIIEILLQSPTALIWMVVLYMIGLLYNGYVSYQILTADANKKVKNQK